MRLETAAAVAGLAGAAQVPGRLFLLPLHQWLGTAHRLPLLFLIQACAVVGLTVGNVEVVICVGLRVWGRERDDDAGKVRRTPGVV